MGYVFDTLKPAQEKKKAQTIESQKRTNAHNIKEALKDNFHVGRNKIAFGSTGIYAEGMGEGQKGAVGTYIWRGEKWVNKEEYEKDMVKPETINILIKIH